jgi:hypothetical protein
MKTYVEIINIVFNNNYSDVERFISLNQANSRYEEIKKKAFNQTAEETIYETGEREITDGEDILKLEFVFKTCSDEDFDMLHPASVAIID